MSSNNVWQAIKSILKAVDVVQYYLGTPDKESGASAFWSSPFRDGDSDPSLSVKDDYITDFGGDFKGDIFQFVMKLKGISKKEALELIKKDFSLNIDTTSSKADKKTERKNLKKQTVVKKAKLIEGKSTEEIWNMFDTVNFKTKPTGRTNSVELSKE